MRYKEGGERRERREGGEREEIGWKESRGGEREEIKEGGEIEMKLLLTGR